MARKREVLPAIANAELLVLKALWDGGPGTVRDLLLRLGDADWAYTTVQTLLVRLGEKGLVAADKRGTAHVFSAVVGREELARLRVLDLADDLLDGAVGPLVLRLAERSQFSSEEIARFRAMLDAAERRARGEGSR